MSCTPKDPTALNFLTHFQAVKDPRQEGKVLFPLEEILLLVLCGVISGADGWTSIALMVKRSLSSCVVSCRLGTEHRVTISWEICFLGWIWRYSKAAS